MSFSRIELRTAATRHLVPGINATQAVILAVAELQGSPLNPLGFDDAALLIRSERLVLDGVVPSDALRTAREELATWAFVA